MEQEAKILVKKIKYKDNRGMCVFICYRYQGYMCVYFRYHGYMCLFVIDDRDICVYLS